MFVMFKMAKPVRTIARITWVSVISTPSYIYIIHAGDSKVKCFLEKGSFIYLQSVAHEREFFLENTSTSEIQGWSLPRSCLENRPIRCSNEADD